MRHFKGSAVSPQTTLNIASRYDTESGGMVLVLANEGHAICSISVENLYNGESVSYMLAAGQRIEKLWYLSDSYGWYDLVVRSNAETGFEQRLAGHVETGQHSVSDPAIAQARWRKFQAY